MNKVQMVVKDGDRTRVATSIDKFFTVEGDPVNFSNFNAEYKIVNFINVEEPKYGITPADADATLKFQNLINSLPVDEKTILFLPRIYNITSLTVPGYVDILSYNSTRCGFKRVEGKNGPMLKLTPYKGTVGGTRYKQMIQGIYLDGNTVGMIKASGIATAGSNVLTGTSSTVGILPGYLIEGYGIPKETFVISTTLNTITLDKPCVSDNTNKTKLVIRKAVTKVAIATLDSNVLSCSDTTGLEVGMRAFGNKLADDSNDNGSVSTWTIITGVTSNTVTLDRVVKEAGSFNFTGFVANDGILLVEAKQAPTYGGGREFEIVTIRDVTVTQTSYHGIVARPERDQTYIHNVKITGCYGYGYYQSGCNDCLQVEIKTGAQWYTSYAVGSGATPRAMVSEIYQTYLTDRFEEMKIKNVPEFTIIASDINGRVAVSGKSDELNDIIQFTDVNFKFTPANCFHDGTSDYYINAVQCTVVVKGGGFKADRSIGKRPNYLAKGKVIITGQQMVMDTANVECPFAIKPGITDPNTIVRIDAYDTESLVKIGNEPKVSLVNSGDTITLDRKNESYIFKKPNGADIATLTVELPNSSEMRDLQRSPEMTFVMGVTTFTLKVPTGDGATIINAPTTVSKNQKLQYIFDKANNHWFIC